MGKIIINRLPVPTWRSLKANYAEVDYEPECAMPPSMILPEGMEPGFGENRCRIRTGCGEELSRELDKVPWTKYVYNADKVLDDPLRLYFMFEEDERAGIRAEINVGAGAGLEVYVIYESFENAKGIGAVQLEINAAENSRVKVTQLIDVSDGMDFINDIGAKVGSDAQVEITQVYLGGKNVFGGIYSALEGYRSVLRTDIGYKLDADRSLDINVVADHTGKRSESEINVRGVLSDKAKKVFRGTIDFKTGAREAKGAESEDVLLLNEEVVNKTIPLILCSEEDVEGSHGASIGRLSDSSVFYMMSRGISYEKVYEIMAEAKLNTVIRKTDDEEMLHRIEKALKRR
ncbi:MAG: SufD family Fe-S cluster assembly protein [Ruminococcus sp.]|nr:SufD family Fe-S cluster assembly protein [Ruminococcus sp.]